MPETDQAGTFSLEPVDERGIRHRLAGIEVHNGYTIEVRTDTGWVSGHYRQCFHPESGAFAFEMHVIREGESVNTLFTRRRDTTT
jgi:hypothetical protein